MTQNNKVAHPFVAYIVIVMIVGLTVMTMCEETQTSSTTTSPTAINADTPVTNPQSIEDAQKFAVGTWSGMWAGGDGLLRKIVFKEGDTCEISSGLAKNNGWDNPEPCTWTVGTQKFIDTGKHFWYVRVKPNGDAPDDYIIRDGGLDLQQTADVGDEIAVRLTRGDHFPY